MTIGSRIKQIRQAVELTQKVFANRIAMSVSYFAEMELDKKAINERTIRLICMEFNINENWLRTGEGSMFNEDVNINVIKITSIFKSLEPDFQECALAQLNKLLELNNIIRK